MKAKTERNGGLDGESFSDPDALLEQLRREDIENSSFVINVAFGVAALSALLAALALLFL